MTKIPGHDLVKSLTSCIVLNQGVLWDFKTEVQTRDNKRQISLVSPSIWLHTFLPG